MQIKPAFLLLLILSLAPFTLYCDENEEALGNFLDQGIDLDLRNPQYADGTLSTSEGGVICGKGFRIQAIHFSYTRKTVDDELVQKISANGDVLMQFGQYLFVCDSVEYDLVTGTGTIHNGRSVIDPWYLGGRTIQLFADQKFIITEGFITTSENREMDWKIETRCAKIEKRKFLTASDLVFRIFKLPLLVVPELKMDLESIFDNPLQYSYRWGGHQGPRFRVLYEFFSWNNFRSVARLEYRVRRGFGGGIETHYKSSDCRRNAHTINYIARDTSIADPKLRTRYRFLGHFHDRLNCDKTHIHLCYDKISDKDMPEDYADDSFIIEEPSNTELAIRHQDCQWTAKFLTRIQVNNFQTVKQDLPSLDFRFRPWNIHQTKIIGDTHFNIAYLDYDYANDVMNVSDYNSARLELGQSLYRSWNLKGLNITPKIAFLSVFYGNSPTSESQELVLGTFSVQANSHFYKYFGAYKHVLEPYMNYQYLTFPTSSPVQHYIFDLNDGLYRLNAMRIGINNNLYYKQSSECCTQRILQWDIYSYAFFNTPTLPTTFQKLYGSITYQSFSNLKHSLTTAWNFQENQLDHFNFETRWTVNEHAAIAVEYRHRGRYDWRKVDHNNFILDSFRPVNSLLPTSLSDKRDTFLLHTYIRFHPYYAFEYQLRHGWLRSREPDYTEMQADFHMNLGSAWNLTFSYQHKEDDHRLAFYFTLGAPKPNRTPCRPVPCLDF